MSGERVGFEVWDAHVHFFSFNFFKTVLKMRGVSSIADEFIRIEKERKIETPPVSPVQLARRWLGEMEKYGVSKLILFASIPNDEVSVATAISAFPDKFEGFFMVNPLSPDAVHIVKNAFENMQMRGVLLFPAMFHFHVYDGVLDEIYRVVRSYNGVVFVHFGVLKIPLRKALGLQDNFDGTYSNPIDLHRVAVKYPDVNFIIPHFGSGYFREVLMLGEQCENVYIDTSGSNSWIKFMPCDIKLEDVFKKAIDVFGVDRIVFGSDSGVFPRGYRIDILTRQVEILKSIGLSDEEIQKILSGNIKRLLGR